MGYYKMFALGGGQEGQVYLIDLIFWQTFLLHFLLDEEAMEKPVKIIWCRHNASIKISAPGPTGVAPCPIN